MNSRWLIPVLTLVAVTAVAYALTQRVLCRRATPGADTWQNVSYLAKELKLTDEQTRQVQALQAELGTQLTDCCARHCAARARLPEALAAGTNGDAAAEARVTEMVSAYEASERTTLAHLRRVRGVLTPQQCRRFDALITECLCGTCSMPGGGSEAR